MQERVRAVIIHKNKLIAMERKWNGALYYVFAGGGVEKGETHKEALIRECLEELNIRVSVGKHFATNTFRGAKEYFYICSYVSGKLGKGNGPEYSRPESYHGLHDPALLSRDDFSRVVLLPHAIADRVASEIFHAPKRKSTNIVSQLSGGDLRSIGKANIVAKKIAKDRTLFDEVFAGIFSSDRVVRARAADACEKASAKNPGLLNRHKDALMKLAKTETQHEVKWHVAQMIGYVWWEDKQTKELVKLLTSWVRDTNEKSAVVRTFALQAIYFLAKQNPQLHKIAKKEIAYALKFGTPAMKARARNIVEDTRVRNTNT